MTLALDPRVVRWLESSAWMGLYLWPVWLALALSSVAVLRRARVDVGGSASQIGGYDEIPVLGWALALNLRLREIPEQDCFVPICITYWTRSDLLPLLAWLGVLLTVIFAVRWRAGVPKPLHLGLGSCAALVGGLLDVFAVGYLWSLG